MLKKVNNMVKIAENEEIIVVPMEESMINEVSKIASHTLGSSFVNEDILQNDINLCAIKDKKVVAYATSRFIDQKYLKKFRQFIYKYLKYNIRRNL